jgi:hypothetical protein
MIMTMIDDYGAMIEPSKADLVVGIHGLLPPVEER